MDNLIVLNPGPDRLVRRESAINPLPRQLQGARVGLLNNGKPNVDNLFAGLTAQLHELGAETRTFQKANATTPARPELLADAAGWADLVIAGMADCGSCTTYCVRDIVTLEESHTPGLVVTSEKFVGLGRLVAKGLGMEQVRFQLIEHPLAGISPEAANDKGIGLANAVAVALDSSRAQLAG